MDGSRGAVRDERTLSGLRNLESDGSSHVRIGHAARAWSLISPPGTPSARLECGLVGQSGAPEFGVTNSLAAESTRTQHDRLCRALSPAPTTAGSGDCTLWEVCRRWLLLLNR